MGKYFESERRLLLRLAYGGAPEAGKTTNLQQVHRALDPDATCPVERNDSAGDQVVTFQAPPLRLKAPFDMELALEVSTVQGECQNPGTRRALFAEADGLIFVADARRESLRNNLVGWADLLQCLRDEGRDLQTLPVVIQLNKLDLPSSMDAADLEAAINPESYPSFEAVATQGRGVGMCFSEIVRRMVARAQIELRLEGYGIDRGALTAAVDDALAKIGARAAQRARESAEIASDSNAETTTQPEVVEPENSEPTLTIDQTSSEDIPAPPPLPAEPLAAIEFYDPDQLQGMCLDRQREQAEKDLARVRRTLAKFERDSRKPWEYLRKLMEHIQRESDQLSPSLAQAVKDSGKILEYLEAVSRYQPPSRRAVPANRASLPRIVEAVRRSFEDAGSPLPPMNFGQLPDQVLGSQNLLATALRLVFAEIGNAMVDPETLVHVTTRRWKAGWHLVFRAAFQERSQERGGPWSGLARARTILDSVSARVRVWPPNGRATVLVLRLLAPDAVAKPDSRRRELAPV